jgi:cobalt-zinc-cadmium efflux system membrane fusion protein
MRKPRKLSPVAQVGAALLLLFGGGGAVWVLKHDASATAMPAAGDVEVSSQRRSGDRRAYQLSDAQWDSLTVEAVRQHSFRSQLTTDGKISIDEDRATPVFSPYAGRVVRLFVKPGDTVQPGQPLFTVEAADMVQAQNDFIAAATALNKARSQLNLAQIVDKRQRDLYEGKAVPLKEVQNARAALDAAENDMRSSEVALEATRNRLRILGKTDAEITAFQDNGTIDPATPIYAPIGGIIVQRKVGPGQYVNTGSSDPVFVVGDLSTVWLLANVRESDAGKVGIGQPIKFKAMAYPDRTFDATLSYVSASVDPATRRLAVRAVVDNPRLALKPEMFTRVEIFYGEVDGCAALPRQAVIYEGDTARVWIANEAQKSIELRQVQIGLVSGDLVQIVAGAAPGEKVVTRGSLFIDRAVDAGKS